MPLPRYIPRINATFSFLIPTSHNNLFPATIFFLDSIVIYPHYSLSPLIFTPHCQLLHHHISPPKIRPISPSQSITTKPLDLCYRCPQSQPDIPNPSHHSCGACHQPLLISSQSPILHPHLHFLIITARSFTITIIAVDHYHLLISYPLSLLILPSHHSQSYNFLYYCLYLPNDQ